MHTRLVFLGPPGAGKGTQAAILSEALKIPAIGTGAIFREAISNQTRLGKEIAQFVNCGLLVPDKLTNAVIVERLKMPDCKLGFILDGYPRSLNQALFLEKHLTKLKLDLDKVFYFKVEAAVVIQRLGKRQMCSKCGTTFNLVSRPSRQEKVCDVCGGELISRSDDHPESILKRMKVYEETTSHLLDHYKEQGKLAILNGELSVHSVAEKISAVCKTIAK